MIIDQPSTAATTTTKVGDRNFGIQRNTQSAPAPLLGRVVVSQDLGSGQGAVEHLGLVEEAVEVAPFQRAMPQQKVGRVVVEEICRGGL